MEFNRDWHLISQRQLDRITVCQPKKLSLAHGDTAAAWSYNPAGLWLFAIMVFQIPFRSYQLWRIGRGKPELVLPWAIQLAFGVLAIALLAQWSLRLAGITF